MKFIYDLAHLITKITAVPVQFVFFRRKAYYEDRKQKNRHKKGGLLYVSNHKSFWDYICYFFQVYLHRLRPVVSELMYRKNPVLRFFLNMCGAIVVGKDPMDLSFVAECVSLLRKGKKIVIFPEAHFIKGEKILPFSPSFARIAIEADVPVVPLYTDGNYSFWHRTRIAVGRRIEPSSFSSGDINADSLCLCKATEEKVRYLSSMCTRRAKTHLLSFKHLPMDFGRAVAFLFIGPAFRHKWHPCGYVENPGLYGGPFIVACNHRSFVDPIALIVSFFRKRIHILVAKEVYGEEGTHKIRKKLLKDIGTIKIDRGGFDIEAMNACCKVLNEGRVLVVFPEGHLVRQGEMDRLQDGAAMLSSRVEVPILPLYLCSSKRFVSRKHFYVGDPIFPEGKGMAAIKKMSSRLYEAMNELRGKAIEEGYEHE